VKTRQTPRQERSYSNPKNKGRTPLVYAFALWALSAGLLHAAGLAPGSTVVVIAQSELKHRGETVRTANAGESLKVVGMNAASGEVMVLVPGANDAGNIVATLPADHVAPVDAGGDSKPRIAEAAPSMTPAIQPSNGYVEAIELATNFKNDKPAAIAAYSKGKVKITGVVDRIEMDPGSLSSTASILITLKTAPGLPRIKAKLTSRISNDKEFYRRPNFNGYWGYSWWENGKIEFRVDKYTSLLARIVYISNYNHSTCYNGVYYNNSYTENYRREGQWFNLISQGEEVFLDGMLNGMFMDIMINNAELHTGKSKG